MIDSKIHYFTTNNDLFAYDVNSTACVKIDRMALSILPEILSGNKKEINKQFASIYPKAKLTKCVSECQSLLDTKLFGRKPLPYNHELQDEILTVSIHIVHKCNLACEYCYADSGTFGRPESVMNLETCLKAIDFVFTHSPGKQKINIGFFGGEPLMNIAVIRKGVAYAKALAAKFEKKLSFSMTTNATLLTPDIMEFLSMERFSLIFSIDGPKRIHDRMRHFASNSGSHKTVLSNIKTFRKQFSDGFTVRGTFTRTTPNFVDQVLFLNNQGFKHVSVEPAQLHPNHPHAIAKDHDILRILAEYDELAKIYLARFDENRPLHFFHFDYILNKLINPKPTHTQCGAGGGLIAIIPDGRIFPCFEMAVEDENCIGDINSGFVKTKREHFQRMHADCKSKCAGCWLKYFCGGGCHAFNIRFNNDIQIPYEPYCLFAKHRFKLAAWILSEIIDRGDSAVGKLKTHLQGQ